MLSHQPACRRRDRSGKPLLVTSDLEPIFFPVSIADCLVRVERRCIPIEPAPGNAAALNPAYPISFFRFAAISSPDWSARTGAMNPPFGLIK